MAKVGRTPARGDVHETDPTMHHHLGMGTGSDPTERTGTTGTVARVVKKAARMGSEIKVVKTAARTARAATDPGFQTIGLGPGL